MIKFLKFIAILFFIVAIFIVSAICGYAYIVPVTYVNLNANTSIVYSLNIYDIVIDSSSSDAASGDIIYCSNYNNKRITEAIPNAFDKLITDGHITKDKNANVTITVTSSDKAKANRIVKKLQESMKNYISGKSEIKNLNVKVKTEIKAVVNK